jgi:predicted PP-loop superfamily ATPase
MLHGFRDVLKDLRLSEATIGVEKNFRDATLYEIFKSHILPKANVCGRCRHGRRAEDYENRRTQD